MHYYWIGKEEGMEEISARVVVLFWGPLIDKSRTLGIEDLGLEKERQ